MTAIDGVIPFHVRDFVGALLLVAADCVHGEAFAALQRSAVTHPGGFVVVIVIPVPGSSTLYGINDKALHFSPYFILRAMGAGAIRQRGVKWAILGLIALGAVMVVIQAFVGRDPSLLDGIANGAARLPAPCPPGSFSILCAWWGYETDRPSALLATSGTASRFGNPSDSGSIKR